MTFFRSATLAAVLCTVMLTPPALGQELRLVYVQPLTPDGIRMVQDRLRAMASYPGPVDGIWGSGSQSALRSFQQSRGLQVTGEINQATAATLGLDPAALMAVAAPPPPAPAPPTAITGDSKRIIQARLRQLGFYKGDVDATWGAASQTALQSFQAANGLNADGRLTRATVQALGVDPSSIEITQ